MRNLEPKAELLCSRGIALLALRSAGHHQMRHAVDKGAKRRARAPVGHNQVHPWKDLRLREVWATWTRGDPIWTMLAGFGPVVTTTAATSGAIASTMARRMLG